ncbi:LSU ribosomal protein L17p [Olavius algarvensis spirochete endosymbiont]|uniref:50S ribosomal protein L17 n=1 Tax=Olavius algarvensis spirochete endosymbiont TaxID=260710 RepID=UPI000F204E4E|nr:50S ribosomal protein L17 [Olavius algarvensis spirochete endosymbiont]VDB01114.1 LSU ribosomal protein L17p [Olavius algarvensis spirochete endosymbiont]
MKNFKSFNKLSRKSSHRKALHRNMVTSIIKHERIKTTSAKAKEVRRTVEKLVTRAKTDSVHNRRVAAKSLYEKSVLNKLFVEVGPRFMGRPGGYTRIMKTGYRSGDTAEMVILEFLPSEEEATGSRNSRKKS